MSELSQLTLFDDTADPSTSLPVVSPASPSVSPAGVKAKRTRGGSGRNSHDLSEKSDPLGYLLRMSLASELTALTGCSLTWKDKGTPAGRSWWVLTTLARHTDESESGSWRTPNQVDAEGGTLLNMESGSQIQLIHQVKATWQTPQASLATAGNKSRSGNRKGELLLTGQVQQWATPRACDADKGGNPRPNQRGDLGAQVKEWPTPVASDYKSTAPPNEVNNSRPMREIAGQAAQENRSTRGSRPGCLNPAWVAALMGWPENWLENASGS